MHYHLQSHLIHEERETWVVKFLVLQVITNRTTKVEFNQKPQAQQISSTMQKKKKKRKKKPKQQQQATTSICSMMTRMVSDTDDCVKDSNVQQLQLELECMKCEIKDIKEQLAKKNMVPS